MGIKDLFSKQNTFEDEDDQGGYGYDDSYDDTRDDQTAGENFGGNGMLELKVVRPESYDAVAQIADHLLNGRTVVLNLEATNKETARRLIDFLSGVAYSIEGTLRRVANNTFVITPHNVDVSGEAIKDTTRTVKESANDDFGF